MSAITSSRKASFIIIAFIYAFAAAVGFLIYGLSASIVENAFCQLFIADVVSTVLVWAFGLYYKNVSVYDPYWSVAPPVILTAWTIRVGNVGWSSALLLFAVWYWGIRLTLNWVYTFRNLDTEDWRYTKYRTEQKSFIFHVINFFGLNMMPTIVVFLAMLPGMDLLSGGGDMTWLSWVAFAVCVVATTIQLFADKQRHHFAKEHRGEVCKVGLWKHGRHPNYFGEILMWWGVWLFYVSLNGIERNLWYVAGPVAMTCLFLFISIPLMEKRQLKNKPGYVEYKKRTRIFI